MSFYDDASWVLIPEGIKEDVVYAQKPTDGLGDLTFTRASDATRTNSAGEIERTPWNLYQFSSAFTNAAWLSGGGGTAVFTDNFATGPSGLFNASRWTAAAIDSQVRQNVATVGTTGTLSVYLRVLSGTKQVRLFINDTVIQQTVTVTTSWQRFTLTGAVGSSLVGAGRVGFANLSVLTNSDYILVADAQYVEGTDAKPYFATTNRQDVPRLDYRNADGTISTCPRLLLEPQRTNSIRNSTMVGAVAGSPGTLPTNWGATLGLTQTIVGTGTENGLQYIDLQFNGTASASSTRVRFEATTGIAGTVGQNWSASLWAKNVATPTPPNSTFMRISERNAGGTALAQGDLTITPTTTLQRFAYTRANTDATCAFVNFELAFFHTVGVAYDFTIRIAAPQMELGAYATTFIPTTTAAVTRLVDTASKTGVSSLIGQTEGTLYCEFNIGTDTFDGDLISVNNGSISNGFFVSFRSSKVVQLIVRTSSTNALIFQRVGAYPIGTNKIAVAYKNGDFAISLNGTAAQVNTSTITMPTGISVVELSVARLYTSPIPIAQAQAALFPTRLSNTELAQITTL